MSELLRKPIHPAVRVNVAKILMDEYGMTAANAVSAATVLIRTLRARGLDIVVGNWMEGERKEGLDWNDLRSLVAEVEERRPWNPPELN